MLEGWHLAYEAWDAVSEITIRDCFRHSGLILSSKEAETRVIRPTDVSAELHNERINIDEQVQITEVITEEDICGEIQSKRQQENVADDSHRQRNRC